MGDKVKKEIYTHHAPWTVFAMNWSWHPEHKFRLAVGSFLEDYTNKVEVVQLDEDSGEFILRGAFDHPYPATKVMWCPDKLGTRPDLLATTGDYLRLWQVDSTKNSVELKHLLNNVCYTTIILTLTEQILRILCTINLF